MERRGSGFKKIRTETANLYGYTKEYAPQSLSTTTAFHVIFRKMNYGKEIPQQANVKVAHKLMNRLSLSTLTSGEKAFVEALVPYFGENKWITNAACEVTHMTKGSVEISGAQI